MTPKEMLPLKLLLVVTVTVKFVPPPALTVADVGAAERLKPETTSWTELLWARAPLVPRMEIADEPGGVETEVLMVMVELPEPVMLGGTKLAVAPLGSPLALRTTLLAKPPLGVIVTV